MFAALGERHDVYRRVLPFFAADFLRLAASIAFLGVALFLVRAST